MKMTKKEIAFIEGEIQRVDAIRWRYFAASPQTALMLGSVLDPNEPNDWVSECNRLADQLIYIDEIPS